VKYVPPTLVRFAAPAPSGAQLNSLAFTEHKILAAEGKTVATVATATPTATDNGTFSGYLAAWGRDLGGDTITGPGAVAETVAAVNRGAITWHLTDSHSERASDVVATVTSATVDEHGVRIAAKWAPGATAQGLRAMARDGHALGLSIDYLVDDWEPDGRGGRNLTRITIVGGAITPKPMNPGATVIESKGEAATGYAPVVTIEQSIGAGAAAAERATPERRREDAMLAAASWPPRHFDRATRLALLTGAAQAKAHHELEGDYERQRVQARREQQNRYSSGLAAWLASATVCGHGSCLPGACKYR
jgi:hypothetical protein